MHTRKDTEKKKKNGRADTKKQSWQCRGGMAKEVAKEKGMVKVKEVAKERGMAKEVRLKRRHPAAEKTSSAATVDRKGM